MKICFIGGGNMARALIQGLLAKGWLAADISVIEPDGDKRQLLEHDFGIRTSDQLPNAALADIIVLAVKPQQLRDLAIFLGSVLRTQLVISVAAGIRSADLSRWLGGYGAVVRVMPNTPAQVQCGISVLFAPPSVSTPQKELAEQILSAVGTTLWIKEEGRMDAVTAVSGSGPAYIFYVIEAMQEAAIELGLSPDEARALSLQTILGATQLALQSDQPPAALRAQVTSKGGTTEQAINTLQHANVKQAIVQAIAAAARRSAELGDALGKD